MGKKRSTKRPYRSKIRSRRMAQSRRIKGSNNETEFGNNIVNENVSPNVVSLTEFSSSLSKSKCLNISPVDPQAISTEHKIKGSNNETEFGNNTVNENVSANVVSLTELSSFSSKSKCLNISPVDLQTISAEHNTEGVLYEESINEVEFHPEGRRLIAIDQFMSQILTSKRHAPFDCNITDMILINEKRFGLNSILTLKCKMCKKLFDLSTDYEERSELNINQSAVLATISSGIGYSSASQFMATLDVPFMAYGTFHACENTVADVIHSSLTTQITENGKQEAHLAKIHGEVDSNGVPCITVIADGAWSKRSYNVNYNALSGVGCIIGKRTGKILFLAVRNKYCCVCASAETKNETPINHRCFKNFTGPSTAMEADIIVEGFRRSMDMHNVKYTKLIGDGDSSITKRLAEARRYGADMIQKIECTNHLIRNFSKNLREVASRKRSVSKNTLVSPQLRKILVSRSYRLIAAVKKAIEYRSKQECTLQEQVSLLIQDMKNAPSHVFGQHKNCDNIKYFNCEKDAIEIDYFDSMSACGLYEDVEACFKRLIENAFSLNLNMTTNIAEQYNAIVCKFVGGKRINFSTKRSYETRCETAALSFNSSPEYHSYLHKQLVQKSPSSIKKKYIKNLERLKSYYKKAKLSKKQLF
ncbi:hypothetical protein FQR65_LT14544 [Abscondita terminalis]|nr:hypothetical protein FQR65_LT14544 [Abscondita terminalis]